MRLNRLLARHGLCSRRKADDWIREGRICIDGIVCRNVGTSVDPAAQRISVDGKMLDAPPDFYYIALNKPKGVLTTRSDPQGRKTVLELLPEHLQEAGVNPVGRLDLDSEGLLLLTNDGDWSRIVTHPSQKVWKTYWVETNRDLKPSMKRQMETGIELDGKKTLPAQIKIGGITDRFFIRIQEGRNRQIRRMCKRIGLLVLELKRVSIGSIELGKLSAGDWRFMKDEEIETVREWEKLGNHS